MGGEEDRGTVRTGEVLAALEVLDDAGLHAVIVRAQGLLLDRPAPAGWIDGLAVEVVDRTEEAVLATYRALGPEGQRRVHAYIERLVSQYRVPGALPIAVVMIRQAIITRSRSEPDANNAGVASNHKTATRHVRKRRAYRAARGGV